MHRTTLFFLICLHYYSYLHCSTQTPVRAVTPDRYTTPPRIAYTGSVQGIVTPDNNTQIESRPVVYRPAILGRSPHNNRSRRIVRMVTPQALSF